MNAKLLLLAALIAAPAIAQPAPPAPPAPPSPHAGHKMDSGMGRGMRMFPSMSEAGRKIMHEAMMAGGSRHDERQKMEAVRYKMLNVLSAEKLDVAAVKRLMDEERTLADTTRQQRQTAMLAAIQKLTPEDRKAFVTDSRAMKDRMQQRMDGWRDRMQGRMGRRGEPGQMPPPPPMED
jgi:Spy/CpxP family protein refolding chaperone